MKIMLYIDKLIVRIPKLLCVLICIVTTIISWVFEPYKESLQITEGIINSYEENIEIVKNPKGGGILLSSFILVSIPLKYTCHHI